MHARAKRPIEWAHAPAHPADAATQGWAFGDNESAEQLRRNDVGRGKAKAGCSLMRGNPRGHF